MDKVLTVLNLMHDEECDMEYASPHFVKDFAEKNNIRLSSDEIVLISNVYGESDDPTGRGE
jgi:hypothetical protein